MFKKGQGVKGRSYVVDGESLEYDIDMLKQSPPAFSFLLQTQCGTDMVEHLFDQV